MSSPLEDAVKKAEEGKRKVETAIELKKSEINTQETAVNDITKHLPIEERKLRDLQEDLKKLETEKNKIETQWEAAKRQLEKGLGK